MNDYDREIRAKLLASLAPVASWVGEECHLSTWCRIDVAAIVNLELHGYEIKAAKDSLRRLLPPHGFQIEEFSKNFDRVTLVCAERHLEEVLRVVPAWWGVSVPGENSVGVLRPAETNPGDAHHRLMQLLWVSESRALARRLGIGGASTKRALEKALRGVPEVELRRALLAGLPTRRRHSVKPKKVVR